MKFDIAIIGGGATGSSAAYFLRSHPGAGSVCVIEPDPAYEFASTPKASGGARRLFSCPENIAMSRFSIEFFRAFDRVMDVNGEPAHIEWTQHGYLFIVPPRGVPVLEANYRVQSRNGVNVRLLDTAGLKRLFPSLHVDDLGAGVYSPDDGWLDPHGVLQGFRRKARALGAEYLKDRVVGIECGEGQARRVQLESGTVIDAGFVINAAGAWAKEICAMVGMPLPVEPMRRFEHYFETPNAIEPLPYVKDIDRLAFRPSGIGYSGGVPQSDEPRGYNFEVDHDYFENTVWPALAHRFPAFEAVKCRSTWAGLYDQNELDGNLILGNWPGKLDNFYVAAGCSGHGLMHAPAMGRALAELILDGGYQTIDLTRLNYRRVIDNRPYPEQGII